MNEQDYKKEIICENSTVCTKENWVYMLRCKDGSLYTGWTNDLNKRMAAHNAGKGARYTRGRGPVQLAYACSFALKSEAMAQEVRLKRLSKAEKEALCQAYARGGKLPFPDKNRA